MKTSTVILVIQGGFAARLISLAYPYSEASMTFFIALLVNAVLIVSFGGFKAAGD
tara:strand:+ start:1202 stop:1366 length:165 start_codon:yes stop_codon:yes gene_type:complete